MAEDNTELNVITHLIQVEKEASALINDALSEADKRISSAKASYNASYKEKYEVLIKNLEENYKEESQKIQENHKKEIQDYKEKLEKLNQDSSSFNELIENLLFHS